MEAPSSFHRRPARARKEQKARANARMVQRLVADFAALQQHRGSQLSRVGVALAFALANIDSGDVSGSPPTAAAASPKKSQLCRHYLRGTCTWGDGCRFAHSGPPGSPCPPGPPQTSTAQDGIPVVPMDTAAPESVLPASEVNPCETVAQSSASVCLEGTPAALTSECTVPLVLQTVAPWEPQLDDSALDAEVVPVSSQPVAHGPVETAPTGTSFQMKRYRFSRLPYAEGTKDLIIDGIGTILLSEFRSHSFGVHQGVLAQKLLLMLAQKFPGTSVDLPVDLLNEVLCSLVANQYVEETSAYCFRLTTLGHHWVVDSYEVGPGIP